MPKDADLTLYAIVPSRSSIVQWMLEEIGRPYRLQVLDAAGGEHRQPAYLAVNPMGKVPALRHGDVVVTEAAAICTYLADAFPEAGLAPPIGDPRRGPWLKWLFFGPSCLEPALLDAMLKRPEADRRMAGWGNMDLVLEVLAGAVAPGPYLLGADFSAADVVIGSTLLWGSMTSALPQRPELQAYMERLQPRPALQRAFGALQAPA